MTVQPPPLFTHPERIPKANGPTYRLLATGARWWSDWWIVGDTFDAVAASLPAGTRLIVVHGHCPPRKDGTPGLDQIADRWAHSPTIAARHPHITITAERHPADWDRCRPQCTHPPKYGRGNKPYCPPAGNYRNQDMVDLGADLAVAAPLGRSTGTRDCMKRAEAAGITVWEIAG